MSHIKSPVRALVGVRGPPWPWHLFLLTSAKVFKGHLSAWCWHNISASKKPLLLWLHSKICRCQEMNSLKLMTYFVSFAILAFHCLDYYMLTSFYVQVTFMSSDLTSYRAGRQPLANPLSKAPHPIISSVLRPSFIKIHVQLIISHSLSSAQPSTHCSLHYSKMVLVIYFPKVTLNGHSVPYLFNLSNI